MAALATDASSFPVGVPAKKSAREMTKAQLQREVEAMSETMVEEEGLLNHPQAGILLEVSTRRIGELVELGKLTRFDFLGRTYPSWHPFTSVPKRKTSWEAEPKANPQGFEGLDHTIFFRDAFVTAPHGGADLVIKSARDKKNPYISAAEIRDVALYYYGATPVLVTCEEIPKEEDGTISKRFALGSMLSDELPAWTWASCGESWDDMRRYILGTPCGSRSSFFVNQNTGKSLREVFDLLNRHELFGPVRR